MVRFVRVSAMPEGQQAVGSGLLLAFPPNTAQKNIAGFNIEEQIICAQFRYKQFPHRQRM